MIAFAVSCAKSIKLDTNTFSSDLLRPQIEFGENLWAIKYENAIILQIGKIDTTDEQPPIQAAIIHIHEKEVVMDLISARQSNDTTIRIYQGNEYRVELHYIKRKDGETNDSIFEGAFVVSSGHLKSEYLVTGRTHHL